MSTAMVGSVVLSSVRWQGSGGGPGCSRPLADGMTETDFSQAARRRRRASSSAARPSTAGSPTRPSVGCCGPASGPGCGTARTVAGDVWRAASEQEQHHPSHPRCADDRGQRRGQPSQRRGAARPGPVGRRPQPRPPHASGQRSRAHGERPRPPRGFSLDGDLAMVHGLIGHGPAPRAVLESALLAGTERGLVVADSALRGGLCTAEDLTRQQQVMQRWPGAQHLQVVTRLADGAQRFSWASHAPATSSGARSPATGAAVRGVRRRRAGRHHRLRLARARPVRRVRRARSSTAATCDRARTPATPCSARSGVRIGSGRSPAGRCCG